jgi:hypothetical protein
MAADFAHVLSVEQLKGRARLILFSTGQKLAIDGEEPIIALAVSVKGFITKLLEVALRNTLRQEMNVARRSIEVRHVGYVLRSRPEFSQVPSPSVLIKYQNAM